MRKRQQSCRCLKRCLHKVALRRRPRSGPTVYPGVLSILRSCISWYPAILSILLSCLSCLSCYPGVLLCCLSCYPAYLCYSDHGARCGKHSHLRGTGASKAVTSRYVMLSRFVVQCITNYTCDSVFRAGDWGLCFIPTHTMSLMTSNLQARPVVCDECDHVEIAVGNH